MKVAIAIDNRSNLSAHFGRSPAFLIFDVEQGQIQKREIRVNDQAQPAVRQDLCHEPPGAPSHDHNRFVSLLGDCGAVVGLGMGAGARHALESAGIRVRLLEEPCPPEEAAIRFESGRLEANPGACCGGHRHPHHA
jgi:predicted Fe-Mo cluster-binding NifX family protein